jgi:hypothetical protein
MTDMTERAFYQDLDSDTAADWTPIIDLDGLAPSLDEWNAARLLTGLLVDTFEEYVTAIKSGKRWNHV